MTTLLPTGEELEGIDAALEKYSVNGPAARAAAIKAFSAGEFNTDTIDAWLAVKTVDQPKIFSGVNGSAANGAGDDAGPKASNPFSKAGWNVTEQGRLLRTLGKDKTAAMAASCGVTIGSTRPNL
jgi:hypothetical protein